MSSFGKWLKQRRAAAGLTQQELAQQVGCSAALLRKIEAGARRPSWQIATLLLHALQIPEAEHPVLLQLARTDATSAVPVARNVSLPLPLSPLTPRENDILALIVQGLPDAAIAQRLLVQNSTVRWYIKQIYSKFAAHRRDELIRQVIEMGLFSRPQSPLPHDSPPGNGSLPDGWVAFLHGDIAGFTHRWQEDPDTMREALARHDALLPPLLAECNGHIFNVSGDSFLAAFAEPGMALLAAATIQHRLATQAWFPLPAHWLKLTLHYGPAELRNDRDYLPNETLMVLVRLSNLAQGGQILLSAAMADSVRNHLPAGVLLEDCGEHALPGRLPTVQLFQVVAPIVK